MKRSRNNNLRRWQGAGHRVEMPSSCVCLVPALAHLLAHGGLKRFEVSAFRKLGPGSPVGDIFTRARTQRLLQEDDPGERDSVIDGRGKNLVALATTLQSWLPTLRRGASTPQDVDEVTLECNRWSSFLVNAAHRFSNRELQNHRIEKARKIMWANIQKHKYI